MKKIIYILLLLLIILPVNVFAIGTVKPSVASLTVEKGKTATFKIIFTNAAGFGTITSADTNIATTDINRFESGEGTTNAEITVTVTGVNVGTTSISLKTTDAASFDPVEDLSGRTETVIINVVDAAVVDPAIPTYTVTYDLNEGTNGPSNQTKTKDETLTLSSKIPTKDKHEFVSWNTKKDGSGTSYLAGSKYTSNANLTLYAQWKSVENADKNPQTGDSTIYIILAIILTFGGYTYWYTKKTKEN